MKNCRSKYFIVACAALAAGTLSLLATASAQQITYYDFDAPQANSNFSYSCGDPAQGPLSTPNPLLCFNYLTGNPPFPQFYLDLYPPSIDPIPTDNPPVQGTHYAVEATPPQQNQANSMWFSVPQRVAEGFTSYFAFKLTPNQASYASADGIAFVVQNALGATPAGYTNCHETGTGPNVVGGAGGCIGYGGIDNSLSFELDTYRNGWDPQDANGSTYSASPLNDNHIAVQNCGAGKPNSPEHTESCLVSLLNNGSPVSAINSNLPVTLADGNIHQVVVNYSGPTEAVPNQLQIFIDPPFVAGTHTPTANAVPVITGTYNLAAHLNLMLNGTVNDSAYVGFTSATGAAFEQSEVLAWTFTPHSAVTQQQPLNPPGTPTVFPYGAHTYTVTYPVGGPPTTGLDMIVTANTVTPAFFTALIGGTSFAGSQCQVYDSTGGNCIIYSVSCSLHGTQTVVPCPSTTNTNQLINIKSAYDNTIQPVSPGLIQGDPLFTSIASITGNGSTASVSCSAECDVSAGQTVTIAGTTGGAFNGTVTVISAPPTAASTFTFASASTGTATGGYVTSNNVQNVFTSYIPQRIDGTTTGKTKNFSEFAVTSLTVAPATIKILAPSAVAGHPAPVTVTVGSPGGPSTGSVSLVVDSSPAITQPLVNGSTTFTLTKLTSGIHQLAATYITQGAIPGGSATGTLTILADSFVFSPAIIDFGKVVVNTTSPSIVETVTNNSSSNVHYVTSTNLGSFTFQPGTCGISPSFQLAPGASCTFGVSFTPGSVGPVSGSITLANTYHQVTLTTKGTGKL